MSSAAGRRAFLFGMTLNELAFILFFLLIISSSSELVQKQNELQQQEQQIVALQTTLNKAQAEREQQFKKLVLLEQAMQTAGGLGHNPSTEELEQFFSRLQAVDQVEQVMQSNRQLQQQLEQLRRYESLAKILADSENSENALEVLENVIAQHDSALTKEKNLRGQVAFLQNKLQQFKAGGRDYPPCWADAESGAIEYLYRIKLYEHRIAVEPAWPPGRKQEVHNIPGAKVLAGGSFQSQQFKQAAMPVLDWSRQHQCRHFVRIYDDAGISKQAFKNKLLMIENYFYKYLER